MKKTVLAALAAITLVGGAGTALADGSPELNRPFGGGGFVRAPSVAAVPAAPLASDADAFARLQADGYRAINVVRGNDGAWHGTAIRGAAKVGVTVDPNGRVYAQ